MKVTRAGVDRSTNYQPDELSAIQIQLAAWDGQVGQGTVPVPDPSGNQEPYWGEQLLLEQSSQTILDGFLGQITSERGGGATGTRRVHTMTLADDNALLQGHASAGWIRPAEAPAARWTAFVTSFLPGGIDTTWLLTTNESGITLPKKTYRSDSVFDDLSADTIGPTGKTVYMEHRNFHWHLPTEGQTCSIVLHDTNAQTSTSFRPLSAQRTKDGMDLRNRIYARNDKGEEVTVFDATSITRHSGAGLHQQGYSEYGSETAAEMTRDINVTLAERKDERVTWTYKIGPLTAAQAVALIPGSQMTVTAAVHSLSAAVKRIAQVTLAYRHVSGTFEATIELGYLKRGKRKPTKTSSASSSSGGSGVAGGGCGGCAPFDASVDLHYWFGVFTFLSDNAGDSSGGGSTISRDVNMDSATLGDDETWTYAIGVIITTGDSSLEFGLEGPSPRPLWVTGGALSATGSFTVAHGHGGSAVVKASLAALGHVPHTTNVTFWLDPPGWVIPGPTSGQQVLNDHGNGDGTTTTFNTKFEYKPGTLHVKINGIDNTDDVTATDGVTVVVGHPPLLNADIVYEYEAA